MKNFEINELTNLMLNLMGGLHPDHLSKDEIELLKTEYGENWMEELGYTNDWLKENPSE